MIGATLVEPSAGRFGRGRVVLVGAGPGDPELITVRGLRRLQAADVVLFDRLASPELLDEVPEHCERLYVGKKPGLPSIGQAEIERLMVDRARRGRVVVRLKGGDPYVFGRGSEEVATLSAHGIEVEVVPGISSALAGPGAAGIPMTHRGVATSFTVVTGHLADDDRGAGPAGDESATALDWHALARVDTLVVLMGVARLSDICRSLQAAGRSARAPAAVVERATQPEQRVVRGCLADIAQRSRRVGVRAPAVLVIGDVVDVRRARFGCLAR